ncbi:MAG: ABC transporter ATP-binding protein/permease [Bacilli bacterium]|nr:ABC transporter ATP-binding protein/permease [Bacilli bacterium]
MFKRFVAYYKPHKKIFVLDMLASFLVAIIGMGYPIITRTMLNTWIPEKNLKFIIIGSSILLAVYLVRALLRYFIQYYGHVMGVHMQAEMRSDLFNKLQKLPYSYYDNHETGTILSTMTNDLFEVSELAHHGPENMLIAGFTIVGALVYLMLINWILGLILVGVVPLLFLITWHYRKQFRKSMRETRRLTAKINTRMESSVTGVRVTKAFTNENLEKAKFENCNNEYVDVRTQIFGYMGRFFSVSQFVTDFFNVVVLICGGLFIYYGVKQFDISAYSVFVISVSLFISPINQLIAFMEQLESASAGFERFIHVMDEEEETIKNGSKEMLSIEGNIEFKDVSFSYDKSNEGVLNNVSFSLEKGKTLALVGPSGGGKTTICHLIPRFYFIEQGQILIDGVDTSEYTLESLRRNIGIVQQDVFLFGGTIRENIMYGNPNATEEELIEAATKANIMEFISALPDGWDTQIGERGVRLSGGQKQRISIARIFLKNPPLLILDEATSALDNATELLIQNALTELAKGRTCIIVAHRLSTIKNADIIAVVEEGKIQEMGTHQVLLDQNGKYKELYDLQFRVDDNKVHSHEH